MPVDNLQVLHDNLAQINPDFKVPIEQFKTDMQDEAKLTKVHNYITSKVPTFKVPYEEFRADMWSQRPEPISEANVPIVDPENIYPATMQDSVDIANKHVPEIPVAKPVAPVTPKPITPAPEAPNPLDMALSAASKGVLGDPYNTISSFLGGLKDSGKSILANVAELPAVIARNISGGISGGAHVTPEGKVVMPWQAGYKAPEPTGYEKKLDEWAKPTEGAEDNIARKAGATTAFIIPAVVGAVTGSPTVAQLSTGIFGASGYVEGGKAYDAQRAIDKKPHDENDRNLSSLLYAMAYTVPIGEGLSSLLPKGKIAAEAAAKMANSPEAQVFAKDVFSNFMKNDPMGAKKLVTELGKGAAHGVTTMEAMELSKQAVNKFLIGKDVKPEDWWNTVKDAAESGALFGFATKPFGMYAQDAANQERRNAAGSVTITKDGIEVLGQKDGVVLGMAPDNTTVELTPEQVKGSFTMATPDFNKAVDNFRKNIPHEEYLTKAEQVAQTVQANFDALKQPDGNLYTANYKDPTNPDALPVEVTVASHTPGGMAILHDGRIVDAKDLEGMTPHPFNEVFQQQMSVYDQATNPALQQAPVETGTTFVKDGKTMRIDDVMGDGGVSAQEIDAEGKPVGRPQEINKEDYAKLVDQQVAKPETNPELRTYKLAGKEVTFTPIDNGVVGNNDPKTLEEAEEMKKSLDKQIGKTSYVGIEEVPGADNLSPSNYVVKIEAKPAPEVPTYKYNGREITPEEAKEIAEIAVKNNNQKKLANLAITGDAKTQKVIDDIVNKKWPKPVAEFKLTIEGKEAKATEADALKHIKWADDLEELQQLKIKNADTNPAVRDAYEAKLREFVPYEPTADEMLATLFKPEDVTDQLFAKDDHTNLTGLPSAEQQGEATKPTEPIKAGGGEEIAAGGDVQGNEQVQQTAAEAEKAKTESKEVQTNPPTGEIKTKENVSETTKAAGAANTSAAAKPDITDELFAKPGTTKPASTDQLFASEGKDAGSTDGQRLPSGGREGGATEPTGPVDAGSTGKTGTAKDGKVNEEVSQADGGKVPSETGAEPTGKGAQEHTGSGEVAKDITDGLFEKVDFDKTFAKELEKAPPEIGFKIKELFHGTPHIVDKFRLDKIGTGEGVQAYGWGLYFTENRGIAEGYAKKLARRMPKYKHPGYDEGYKSKLPRAIASVLQDFSSKKKSDKSTLKDIVENRIDSYNERLADYKKRRSSIENNETTYLMGEDKDSWGGRNIYKSCEREIVEATDNISALKNMLSDMPKFEGLLRIEAEAKVAEAAEAAKIKRHIYTVGVGEEKTNADYIPWHEPISDDQLVKIEKAIRDIGGDPAKADFLKGDILFSESNGHKTGAEVYEGLTRYFKKFGSEERPDKQASEFLDAAGIAGIEYPTEYLSKRDKNQERNYVIFDEGKIEIIKDFGFKKKKTPEAPSVAKDIADDLFERIDFEKALAKEPTEVGFQKKSQEEDALHKAAVRTAKSAESYKVMDADPDIEGSTWSAGGCYAFAKALQKVHGGELVSIKNDKGEVQHIMLRVGDKFLDSDGLQPEAKKLKTSEDEGVTKPTISAFDSKEVDASDIGKANPHTVDKLADLMKAKEPTEVGFQKKAAAKKLAKEYKDRLSKLKEEDPAKYWSVDLPSDDIIRDAAEHGRLVDINGGMGIVTEDGNLIGLFKYTPEAKGTAKAVQAERIKLGGLKLDAYDTKGTGNVDIVGEYEKSGFREVARVEFNPDAAPADMPENIRAMKPDVVVMAYDPEGVMPIKERTFGKDEYEQALSYRYSYMAEEPVPDHNKSADTQGFFSDVVTGKSDKYKPRRKWQPLMTFTKAQEAVRSVYEKFNGKFDEHIATSIPGFRDIRIKVVAAVNDLFGKKGGLVYDIGGSEGGFGKTITELSDGRVKSINLDASSDMEKVHNATPVEGATFVKEAFGEGFEWDGETFKKHVPTEKADVVHESMTFQFIDEKRNDKLTEVVDNYLKPDGLFITEEKVHPKEDAQWRANEAKKDADFKSRYYDKDQIDIKREEVLTGMVTNQTTYARYKNELLKKFDHVAEYWDSGNFKGFVASNDKAKVDAFLEKVGNTDTEFSEKNVNPAEVGPETSANYANLTEDGKGNFVFYHYSRSELDKIDPKKYGSNPSRPTSGEEASAMGKVGGLSQFYTDRKDAESKLGSYGHEVRVPVDKVYDVNKDPLNLYDEAKKQFSAKYPDMAFGPNDQVAWITKVAADKGYTMTIAEWNGKTRAQSVVPQTPSDVQKLLGRVIVKGYNEEFKSNRDLGYTMGEGKSIEPKEVGFQAQKLFTHKGEVPKFKSLTELTKWLGSWGKKNKVFASEEAKANDKTFVNKLAEHTLEELRAWDGLVNYKYLGFYDYDIPSVLNPGLQKFAQKRYGRELTNAEISLYHIVSGFASPGSDPVFDSSVGLGVFDKYMRTGEITSKGDKEATLWHVAEKGGKPIDTGEPKVDAEGNPVMAQVARAYATHALGKLNTVISKFDGNLDKAIEWLTSKHSYEELAAMVDAPLKGTKALSEHENLTKEDGAFGMFALTGNGAKLGSYLLNRVGEFSTVTKDLWYARTMARLTGEPLQDEAGKVLAQPWNLTKEGIRKRKLADEAWGIVAEKLGITPAIVQQRMWDFEKRLYEQLGTDAKSGLTGYASEGFAKKAKELEPTLDLTDTMSPAQIDKAAEAINTEPTEAQKEAGNYRMGHVGIKGMDISLETPRGATRSGVDAEGKPWSTAMQDHYGYFKGSKGKDGDHIDTFIGQHPESNWAFVVDQIDPKTGKFDESKVMMGYENIAEARAAYDRNYAADWTGFKDITAVPVSQLKTWLYDGAQQGKPFAEYVDHNELYKHSAAEAKLVENIVGALDTGKNRDFPTKIMDNNAVADHFKGKISEEFVQDIRDTDWAGLYVGKEVFVHPDTTAEEAVVTWVHEQSHVQFLKDHPKLAERTKFAEDLYDRVGEEEIKRVVPDTYWLDGEYDMAKEYLAHLAEDIPNGGELLDKAPEDIKKLIFDNVNSFTTLKDIQDAKEIISNQKSGNRSGDAYADSGDRGRLAENEGNSGKGADDLNASLRQAPGGEEESLKAKQLKIVTEANPMTDDYHTGIRSEKDILTAGEAFAEGIKSGDGAAPDFKSSDMGKALSTGKVTVYSSNPIENGAFVSPSRMEAKNYAGDGKVYSKEVNTSDVAWIDDIQGQYAKVELTKDIPTPKEGKIKVDGVERHVQNSEGEVIHPTIGGVENFWRWFGESEAKDAEGRPLVLYHGAERTGFNVFDESKAENKQTSAPEGSHFFTDNKDVAYGYSGSRKGVELTSEEPTKPGIYKVYLNLKDPNRMDFEGADWQGIANGKFGVYITEQADYLRNAEDGKFFDSKNEAKAAAKAAGLSHEEYLVEFEPDNGYTTNDVVNEAKRMGNDGAIIYDVIDNGEHNDSDTPSNIYVVLDAKQIKSVDLNSGDFDPNKPEINFRKREPKETLFDYFRAEALDKAKWVPGVTEVAEPIGEFSTALKNTMVPYAQKEGGKLAAKSMTANLGDMQRGIDVAEKQLRGAEKKFNKMTNEENLDFIDRMESNLPQPTPELQGYADALRGQIDGARDRVRALGTGKLETFIENYFPHYWEDPKKADALLASVGRRPLEGPKTFLKKRTIEYTREGVDKGLIPVSWNPVKLALLKIREMERYTMAHATIKELKEAGYIKYVRMGQDKPEGFVPIDDKVGTVMKMNPDTHMLELMGHYYAEPNSARILNNFLSKGLRGNAAFDIYRGLGNTITQLQLGLSAFHLGFTSMDAAISTQAIGWEYLYHGKVGAAMKQFIKAPISPVTNFLTGDKLMKAWYGDPTTPQMGVIADMMAKAGGRAKMDDFYQEKWMDKIRENVRNRRYVKAAWQVPMQLIELTSKPILSYIVPRQKLGVFADMAKYEMKLHPDATPEELRGRLQKAWASVDNRMGQLVYDNLFWNHVTKDIAMATVRSVGWNLGTFREVGGAPKEALNVLTSAAKGQTAEQTHKLAYMISLVTTTALSSAIFQYLRTGKAPEEPKDYFFPKDGGVTKDGDPSRVSMPTYMKDLYHYSSDFPSGALTTLKNKLSPVNGIVAQMISNKDYYGTKVFNEDDTSLEKTKEIFSYLGQQLIPFGIRNVQKSTSDRLADKVLPFIGIVPAPSTLNKTIAEIRMSEIMREKLPIGGRTKEQADKSQIKSDIRNQFLKSGSESVLDEAVKANKITDTDADKIWEDAQLAPIERSAKRLNPTELFGVYKIATPEEKKLISPILMDKIFNAEDKEPDELTMEKLDQMINVLEEDNKK